MKTYIENIRSVLNSLDYIHPDAENEIRMNLELLEYAIDNMTFKYQSDTQASQKKTKSLMDRYEESMQDMIKSFKNQI